MSVRIRPLVAGNWKMNGMRHSVLEFRAIRDGASAQPGVDVLIAPPATLIRTFYDEAQGGPILVGAQDSHVEPYGAHTGDLSAEMLADAGASAVIVGHSERRDRHRENDRHVHAKTLAVWRAGLIAIVCVGETLEERETGRALEVVTGQLANSVPDGAAASTTVIAYEPIWAIGTGLTPKSADIVEMHRAIRATLVSRFGAEGPEFRILYGGSVKPDNAAEILALPDVDGALVGGASLKAVDFLRIVAGAAPGR